MFIGVVFYIASVFLVNNYADDPKTEFTSVFVSFMTVLSSSLTLSQAADVGKGRESARKVFEILDEKSALDIRDAKGQEKVEKGEIEF